jgi:AAA+ superfamily predicted ATPase
MNFQLTPAQKRVAEGLLGGIPAAGVLVLRGAAGSGKTTVLEHVHSLAGGILLGVRQFMRSLAAGPPYAIEEAFLNMLEDAMAKNELVFVDDLNLVTQIVTSCDYPRGFLLDAALTAALSDAAAQRKKLVFALDSSIDIPWPLARRAYTWEIKELTAGDYAAICREVLGEEVAASLDYDRLHRFAPSLSIQNLAKACHWLRRREGLDTEGLLGYLRSTNMISNVELNEVERVSWTDLKGVDHVIRELEAKIALPFENDQLSVEYRLKPKRGVLLAGPPGTGKTTIGRALAHRLKSKFFLIDGTAVAGSNDFYCKVNSVFDAAKRNAPSVVFIDDADVLFENEENRGFYRYLLTLLDGIESARAARVCVMMTAMNAASLPLAMLRSGRVELWLETRLPGDEARAEILRAQLDGLPAPFASADHAALAALSRGLTGADLKSAVEDAKLIFAHDRASGLAIRPTEDYFREAVESVRQNRRTYSKKKPVALAEAPSIGFVS